MTDVLIADAPVVSAPVARGARLVHHAALDGVRGVAVAGVLLFHGGYLQGGYLGVDAFFVLSGFLITSLLLAEAGAQGRISLRRFWARRARRLLPALGCVLVFVAVYAVFIARPEELATIRGDALATMAYVANWRQVVTGTDYFALFRSPSPLQHMWSLAIEEQFYLVWPVVVVLVTRRRAAPDARRRVLVVSLVLAGVSVALAQVLYHPGGENRVYYGTDTRAASILVGAALAAVLTSRPASSARATRALGALAGVACIGLGVAWTALPGSSVTLYRGGLVACALATAAVIAACVRSPRSLVARALSIRVFRGLGLISYGAYLWHWPVYVVMSPSRMHVDGLVLLALRLAVTIAIALVSYRFVERPIRLGRGTRTVMRRAVPAVVIALVVAIIASTGGAPASGGLRNRTSSGGVLVVGDSVAHNIALALGRAGLGVNDRAVYGCSLIAGFVDAQHNGPSRSCGPFATWARAQHPMYALVVAGLYETLDFHPRPGAASIRPGTAAYARVYTTTLQRDIDALAATGATVIIPTVPCMAVYWMPKQLVAQLATNPARLRIENALLASVVQRPQNRGRVVSPDLGKFVCPAGHYQHRLQGVADARPDGMHFAPPAADLVAHWLIGEVPGLRRAIHVERTRAEVVVDGLDQRGLICQMSLAVAARGPRDATVVPCAYKRHTGVAVTGQLRVFSSRDAAHAYENLLVANTCLHAARAGEVGGYLHGSDWVLTGAVVTDGATLTGRRLTAIVC